MGEIGEMFLRRRFDECALSETKLKGKGEVSFVRWWAGCLAWREAGCGKGWPSLSGCLMRCVVEWKEVSSWLMWVRVKIERERVGCLYRHMDRVVRRGRRR